MNKEAIFETITTHAKEVLTELSSHDFRWDDSLADLGANSMERAEIVGLTLESLNLDIARIELFGAQNIGQLADILYAKVS